jgi:hypothetical protein
MEVFPFSLHGFAFGKIFSPFQPGPLMEHTRFEFVITAAPSYCILLFVAFI